MSDTIVIGVDFGTTFSGVAWARARGELYVHLVTNWNSVLSRCSTLEKVPSKLFFDPEMDDATILEQLFWGYNVPLGITSLEWFKIMLLEAKDIPFHLATAPKYIEALGVLEKLQKSPSWILSAYLRGLWNHVLKAIARTVGQSCVDACNLHIVITLAAIWPHYVQKRVSDAARAAGMLNSRATGGVPKLSFISEPEAAAMATLQDVSTQPDIKDGDTFLVCDAGGGTVDVITYTLHGASTTEAVEGEGDLCGAMNLDNAFLELVKGYLPTGSWDYVTKINEQRFLASEWEQHIKVEFDNTERDWTVTLPMGCQTKGNRLKRKGDITFTSDDIASKVFDPVINRILRLTNNQCRAVEERLGAKPTHIILVGGFGRNQYLGNRMQEEHAGVSVLQAQGQQPWTAICRGAVLYGLSLGDSANKIRIKIGARVARNSYGISVHHPWDPVKHLPHQKYWDDITCAWKARDQMVWFLKRGQDIASMSSVRHNFHRDYITAVGDVREAFLISSEGAPSPYKDETVDRLCEVNWNKTIRLSSLPARQNSRGETYRRLDFSIEMTITGPAVEFVVYYQDHPVANCEMNIDFPVLTEA